MAACSFLTVDALSRVGVIRANCDGDYFQCDARYSMSHRSLIQPSLTGLTSARSRNSDPTIQTSATRQTIRNSTMNMSIPERVLRVCAIVSIEVALRLGVER